MEICQEFCRILKQTVVGCMSEPSKPSDSWKSRKETQTVWLKCIPPMVDGRWKCLFKKKSRYMHGPAAHTHTRHNATQINLTLTLTHHCPTLITLDPRHHPPPHWRAARVQLLAVHIVLCYGGGPFTCPLPAGASTCMGGFLVYSGGNEIAEVSASKSKFYEKTAENDLATKRS